MVAIGYESSLPISLPTLILNFATNSFPRKPTTEDTATAPKDLTGCGELSLETDS
jgi:hypothetical protein